MYKYYKHLCCIIYPLYKYETHHLEILPWNGRYKMIIYPNY